MRHLSIKPLVVVNGHAITENEVNHTSSLYKLLLRKITHYPSPELRRQVLQEMIENEAIVSMMPPDQTWNSQPIQQALMQQAQMGMLPPGLARSEAFRERFF